MQLSSVRVITITLVIKSVSQKANRNNIVQWAIKLVIGDSELVIGKMTLRKWAVSFIRVEDLECNSFVVGESGLGVGRRWRRQDADQYCPWKHCGRDGLRDRLVKWDPPPSSTGLWGELEPTKTFHSSAVVITQTLKKKIKWNPAVWSERAYGICIRLCRTVGQRRHASAASDGIHSTHTDIRTLLRLLRRNVGSSVAVCPSVGRRHMSQPIGSSRRRSPASNSFQLIRFQIARCRVGAPRSTCGSNRHR